MGTQDPRLQQRSPVPMPAATTPPPVPLGMLPADASTAQVYGAMSAPPEWVAAMSSRFGLTPGSAALPAIDAPTFYTPPSVLPPAMAPAAPITSPSLGGSAAGLGSIQQPTSLGDYFRGNRQALTGLSPQELTDAYLQYQANALMQQQKVGNYLASMGYERSGEPAVQPFGGIRFLTG